MQAQGQYNTQAVAGVAPAPGAQANCAAGPEQQQQALFAAQWQAMYSCAAASYYPWGWSGEAAAAPRPAGARHQHWPARLASPRGAALGAGMISAPGNARLRDRPAPAGPGPLA